MKLITLLLILSGMLIEGLVEMAAHNWKVVIGCGVLFLLAQYL